MESSEDVRGAAPGAQRRTREVGVLERFAVALGDTRPRRAARHDPRLDGRRVRVRPRDGAPVGRTDRPAGRGGEPGYPASGVGASVRVGDGLIGVVARRKKLMRMGGFTRQRGYAVAIRDQLGREADGPEIRFPGSTRAERRRNPAARQGPAPRRVRGRERTRRRVRRRRPRVDRGRGEPGCTRNPQRQLLRSERERRAELEQANARLTTWNEASRRFVPFEFLAILGRRELPEIQRGDSAHKLMSAFFSDIRDYTTIVESQDAPANFPFINEYLESMEAPIRAHAGIVDSYHGDGIMALFGGSPDDAVAAAVDSLAALASYNEAARTSRGSAPLRIGIGIDTGRLMLGTMGSSGRLAASAIGDSANTASRVESATKLYGATILITTRTRDGLSPTCGWQLRAVDNVRPRGQRQPVTLYEVLDGLSEDELAAKRRACRRSRKDGRSTRQVDPGRSCALRGGAKARTDGSRGAAVRRPVLAPHRTRRAGRLGRRHGPPVVGGASVSRSTARTS